MSSSSARPDPARMYYTDGHALSAQESDSGALRFRLIVGALDTPDVRTFRDVLASLAARARICVTVDLAGLDDGHHLTAVAVLWTAASKMQDMGSALTACNPPRSLARVLKAIPIPVTYERLGSSGTAGIQVIQVGAPAAEPPPAARRGHMPAVPDSRRG